MDSTTAAIIGVCFAYLVGSIPFAFLMAQWVAGIDIRTKGSGNVGATNVGRVVGMKWGLAVLALDCLKGLLPVLAVPYLFLGSLSADSGAGMHLRVVCGIAAIAGHMFPCWLRFRGGKGVATALGVVIVLSPWMSLIAAAVFTLSFLAAKIVSLSSIAAAVTFAAGQMFVLRPNPFAADRWSLAAFSLAIPMLIVYRHRSNISRLLRGTEPKLTTKGEENADGEDE